MNQKEMLINFVFSSPIQWAMDKIFGTRKIIKKINCNSSLQIYDLLKLSKIYYLTCWQFFKMNSFSLKTAHLHFKNLISINQIIPSNYSCRSDLRKLFEVICYLNSNLMHMKEQNLIYIISG